MMSSNHPQTRETKNYGRLPNRQARQVGFPLRWLTFLAGAAVLLAGATGASAQALPDVGAMLPAVPAAQVDAGIDADLPVQQVAGTVTSLDPTGTTSLVMGLLPDGHVGLDASAGTSGVHACSNVQLAVQANACADVQAPDAPTLLQRIQGHATAAAESAKNAALSTAGAISGAFLSVRAFIGF